MVDAVGTGPLSWAVVVDGDLTVAYERFAARCPWRMQVIVPAEGDTVEVSVGDVRIASGHAVEFR